MALREGNRMEGLAPPLKCLIEIQFSLQNGDSVRSGLVKFLQIAPTKDPFTSDVRRFLFDWEQGNDWRRQIIKIRSPYRRSLIEILASGLEGQPISAHLEELRGEIVSACDGEIRHQLEMLPLKMLFPLLAFQFPAFLLLLFGPLLKRLIEELNR
jgi:hypothetical protein